MSDRVVKFATYAWMAAIALCILGPIKIFAPLTIVLLGVAFSADTSERTDRAGLIMGTLMTAVAIFFGIQQHQSKLGQVAYWAHRQAINCKDADRWEATGGRGDYPFGKPTQVEIHRCGEIDDGLDYKAALEENGW